MPFKCVLSCETLLTGGAGEDRRKSVKLQVIFEILGLLETLLADCATKRFCG